MTYQVIARKWRPQTFEEVTGQEPITRTLRNAIEHDRLHHAYLFSGARGVGKTTTARLLAKAVNCHKSDKPTPAPCSVNDPDACASCREVAEGRSIDVQEIDAASNTGVDNVRESIINTVGIRPARDRYKVFIIDEVHMLSGAAFNALLKTLEEPPPRVLFIMATTEAHKLPDTILSRCQQFEFRTIPVAKIADRLRRIADAEQVDVGDDALHEIARAGEGSMRDAQSAFDQVISFSGERITTETVETALGLAGTELLRRTMRGVADRAPAEVITVVEDLVMRGHDLRNFTRDLLAHVRDLLIARVGGSASHKHETGTDKEFNELAARFSESDLVRFFHSLTLTERDLRDSAHPRYQLEIGLVKLIEIGRLARLDDVLERLSNLEGALRGGGTPSASGGGNTAPPTGGSLMPPSRRAAGGSGGVGAAPSQSAPTPSPAAAIAAPSLKLVTQSAPDGRAASTFIGSGLGSETRGVEGGMFAVAESSFMAGAPPEDVEHMSALDASSAPAASLVERIKAELEKRRRAFVAVALEEAQRVALEDGELCVEFSPKTKHLRDNLTRPENIKALREVCHEVTGRDLGLKITVCDPAEVDRANEQPTQQAQLRKKVDEEKAELWRIAEEHPTIKSFMKVFRGEIIDVRRVSPEASQENQS